MIQIFDKAARRKNKQKLFSAKWQRLVKQYGVSTAQNRRRLGWNSVRSAKNCKIKN